MAINSLLDKLSAVEIAVLGDVMLDSYWFGATARISPEAPVPVVHVGNIEQRPGGAGNVALNLASLGVKAHLLGVTGDDQNGQILTTLLAEKGIHCGLERVAGRPTINKLRVISRNQQLMRLDFEMPFVSCELPELNKNYTRCLHSATAVILSDYGKGTLSDPAHFIKTARACGVPVLVDPKGDDFTAYRGASLITPNMGEFERIVGRCTDDQQLVERGMRLLEELNLEALLITRSEKGMSLLRRGKSAFHLPAQAQEVYDVTGAGDTVIACMAAMIGAGSDYKDAARIANLAAGLVVAKLGAASVTVEELKKAQEVHHGVSTTKLLSENRLVEEIKKARHAGETIVMTNGCFDILHAGHVYYLEQAKKQGSRLIVAVNDDASVSRLKGSRRPINTLEDRKQVLAALESVDWVVAFSEDTPERLICAILPDVLVKGGDYSPEQIAGHQCVLNNGGKIEIIATLAGRSTTGLINNLKNK